MASIISSSPVSSFHYSPSFFTTQNDDTSTNNNTMITNPITPSTLILPSSLDTRSKRKQQNSKHDLILGDDTTDDSALKNDVVTFAISTLTVKNSN